MFIKRAFEWAKGIRRDLIARHFCIESAVEATGCSRKEAAARINDARKRLGISYTDYRKMKMYHYSPEEQEEIYSKMLKDKEEKEYYRQTCKEAACEAMGWTMSEASRHAEETHFNHGISFRDYLEKEIYRWSDEQILEFGTKAVFDRNKRIVEKIMKKTGWSREEAYDRFADTRRRTGCRMKEYNIYRMYELSEDEQEKVFLVADSRKIQKEYDREKFSSMLLDKEWANNYFSDFLRRRWCSNTNISLEEFQKIFEGTDKIIYKPAFGSRGKGTEAVSLKPGELEEAYRHITSLPDGVVEEFVIQHPDMNRLTPASVNTIRVVTISSLRKPVTPDGKHKDIAYIAVRIGGGSSIVDNFHSGGMVAAADLEKGTICTDAADMKGNVFKKHPVTGTVFKGFRLPYFEEIKAFVYDMIEKKEVEGYIGWDIAVSKDGPVLIEVNTQPGAVLISTPYAAEHKGMKPVMEKYMIGIQ